MDGMRNTNQMNLLVKISRGKELGRPGYTDNLQSKKTVGILRVLIDFRLLYYERRHIMIITVAHISILSQPLPVHDVLLSSLSVSGNSLQ